MSLFYSKTTGGFYDNSIHTPAQIPTDAVAVSQTVYNDLMAGQSEGSTIGSDVNGNPILVAPVAPTLAQVQASALTSIDQAAEQLRALYITANSGQVATYILKYNEATAFQTAGYAGTVPGLVQSEVAATGSTAQVATESILAQYAAWSSLAASIETVRRSAKVAVNAATTTDGVAASVATATTGFAAIQAAAGTGSST